jgi:hypothetical protein
LDRALIEAADLVAGRIKGWIDRVAVQRIAQLHIDATAAKPPVNAAPT